MDIAVSTTEKTEACLTDGKILGPLFSEQMY